MTMVHSFEALGTKWWITVFDELETLDIAFSDIERFVADFEARYSRFLPDSLISRLNHDRILQNPSDECRALLQYGKRLYLRTGGAFNILTGHILEARGYDNTHSFTDKGAEALTPGNPITDLLINSEHIELHAGNLDIGGFGKGYLIDLIATRLRDTHRIQHFLINGGGDMYATSKAGSPIEILLEHPTKPKKYIAKVRLQNQGFAASSPFKRIWGPDGSLSHIVAQSQIHHLASFVIAPTAADADAFATTALLLDVNTFHSYANNERFQAACFDPKTDRFTHTKDFPFFRVDA